jgi:hypothetical protein
MHIIIIYRYFAIKGAARMLEKEGRERSKEEGAVVIARVQNILSIT